jgi:hypothetical protein
MLISVFISAPALGAAPSESLPAIMVLTIKHEEDAGPGIAKMLTEIVLQDIYDLKKFRVVGEKDINQMLNTEQRKQLAGCTDTSCLVEIAGAMGTQYTIDGTVGVVGQSNLVALSLIDVGKAAVVSRKTAVVKGEREQLLETVHKLIAELMAPVLAVVEARRGATQTPQAASAPVPGPRPPGARQDNDQKQNQPEGVGAARAGRGPPVFDTTKAIEPAGFDYRFWGKVGVFGGAGVVVVGGVFSFLSVKSSDDFQSAADPAEMKDGKDKARLYGDVALGSYLAGGALAAGGAVLWMIAPLGGVAVSPSADREGVYLRIGGVW